MSAADVLNKINEYGVKFVDFRFTDTIGKEQHVSVPASVLNEETFTEGKMFDGSSITAIRTGAGDFAFESAATTLASRPLRCFT